MKYLKMLGLALIAMVALMAFAGAASATVTEAPGDPADAGDIGHGSAEGSISVTGSITITCQKSTIGAELSTNDLTVASGPIKTMTFEECGNHTVTVVQKGSLAVTSNSEVFSTGAEVTSLLHSFLLGTVHCIYTTSSTDVGTITGGTTAKLDIISKPLPRSETDEACGEHATLEGNYIFTTPDTLLID